MRICIHRGAQEIGGTCIEIESGGFRLVLDVGLPLNAAVPAEVPLPPVPGFAAPDESLLGVVISHPHLDHYGLAHRLPPGTPFLIGQAAHSILSAAALFTPGGLTLPRSRFLEDRISITLGPFTITPFLIDHSAYDSYAILVEADNRKLFYTGDFRAHGRKSRLFDDLIANPPGGVDILLMEGTCLGRPEPQSECRTEEDLVEPFTKIFQATKGMPLVWCSGQNLDRIVTIWKACGKSRRQLILDMYTAEILRATGNSRMPQAGWHGMRVFLPASQKHRIVRESAFHVPRRYLRNRIFTEGLRQAADHSVMLFRPSMVREIDAADCTEGAVVVCSVWSGYLDSPGSESFRNWLEQRAIPVCHCHTSGHAYHSDLQRMRNAFPQAVAVPVHLQDRAEFASAFCDVRLHSDGEWWSA